MAYFPSVGLFYDPDTEQEVYGDHNDNFCSGNKPASQYATNGHSAQIMRNRGDRKNHDNINNDIRVGFKSRWQDLEHPVTGDMFFVNDDKTESSQKKCVPHQSPLQPSLVPDRHIKHSKQEAWRSDITGLPLPKLSRGSGSEEDEEDRMRSRAELRKKSKQLQQALQKTHTNGDISASTSHRKSGSKTSQSHSRPVFIQTSNSRQLLSHSHSLDRGNSDITPLTHQTQAVNGATSQKDSEELQLPVLSRQSVPQSSSHQLKVVILVPDCTRHSESSSKKPSGAELFELLFGIVLCRYNQRTGPGDVSDQLRENRECKVVVQGVVEGSPADKSGNISRGDMLLYLNGQEVTWSSLDVIIQNLKKEVKLTFQTPRIVGPTSCNVGASSGASSSRLPAHHNLCLLVTGQNVFSLQQRLLQHRCVALYLTFTNSAVEITPNEDIIYSFPSQEEPLTALRGLFLTLSSSLHDAVQAGAECSSLLIRGELVNAVYHRQGREVFILAAPNSRVPLCLLKLAMTDTCRMLGIVFGSVERAFHNCESCQLDQVFALLFHRLLRNQGQGGETDDMSITDTGAVTWWQRTIDSLHAAPILQLSEENNLICDEILSEYESMDFDDFLEENELYARRSYVILGSSLFYKNFLVCNHLHAWDLQDVGRFLRCHCLLTLSAQQCVDQVMFWQEVHLSRFGAGAAIGPLGYMEPPTRCFMLIVGMKHFLLVTLLEAGGCSQPALGRPGPYPLLVEQARATLAQLDADDAHMSSCCQDRLTEDLESVHTTSVDRFVTQSKLQKDENSALVKASMTSKPPSPGRAANENPFKYRSSPRSSDRRPGGDSETGSESGLITRQGSKLSYGSNDSGGSGSSAGTAKNKGSRFSSLLDMSAIGRSMSALHIDTIGSLAPLGKINRGKDNMLFHFVHCNDFEGILVASSDIDLTLEASYVREEVMDNFHRCVINIHDMFQAEDENKHGELSSFECETVVSRGLLEHGILFYCSRQSNGSGDHKQLGYWVVGRRFQSDCIKKSFFVCFHESCSQTVVEMAFALHFGT